MVLHHNHPAWEQSREDAPDVVVGLAGGGDQVLRERRQGGLRAVPPVRLVLLHAVDVDVVVACPADTPIISFYWRPQGSLPLKCNGSGAGRQHKQDSDATMAACRQDRYVAPHCAPERKTRIEGKPVIWCSRHSSTSTTQSTWGTSGVKLLHIHLIRGVLLLPAAHRLRSSQQ